MLTPSLAFRRRLHHIPRACQRSMTPHPSIFDWLAGLLAVPGKKLCLAIILHRPKVHEPAASWSFRGSARACREVAMAQQQQQRLTSWSNRVITVQAEGSTRLFLPNREARYRTSYILPTGKCRPCLISLHRRMLCASFAGAASMLFPVFHHSLTYGSAEAGEQ